MKELVRILSILVCLCMLFTALPCEGVSAWAELSDEAYDDTSSESATTDDNETASADVEDEADDPVTMSLDAESVSLTEGDTYTIQPVFSDNGAYSVSFALSEEGIVEIDDSGLITAVAAGSVTVQVVCTDLDTQASLDITVEESDEVSEGDEETESSETESEEIDTITETTTASASLAAASVTVSVAFDSDSVTLAVGQTYTLTYTCDDDSLASAEAFFTSSDSSVATVDSSSGLVTAISEGTAVITLSLDGTEAAQATITVFAAPAAISVNSTTLTMGKGQTVSYDDLGVVLYADTAKTEMTVGGVTYKTSSSSIVKITDEGLYAKATGTATITITAYNGVKTTIKVTVKKAPSSLTISPTSASLAVGQTGKITCKITSGTAAGYTFTSSDESVATVDSSGNVTAVSEGTATITVTTHNGLSKKSTITVTKAPENVTLTLSAETLGVGMTATASGSVDTTSSYSFTYTYWTEDTDIISVDADTGEITAISTGTATVYVETYNGITTHEEDGETVVTSAIVTVVPAADNITIDTADTVYMVVGYSATLPVTMTTSDGSTDCLSTYTITSSKTAYAKVSGTTIKAVKKGTTTIKVKLSNGATDSIKLVVLAKPTKVTLSSTTLTLGVGMSSKPTAKYYSAKYYTYSTSNALNVASFTSSDESVATVDENGTITAVGVGTATIRFKTVNGKYKDCKVTVLAVPTEMTLSPETTTLGVGMTSTLTPTFGEDELGEPTYVSSDPSIATVDSDGTVTAVSVGTVTITATVGDNVTATSEITVVPAADTITIDGASTYYVFKGCTITLPVTMTTSDGGTECLSTYTVKTSKSSYASVSGTKVKGVTAGKTVTITVTLSNGAKDTVKVKVLAAPTKVKLSSSTLTIGEGMTSTLTAKYYSSSTWYTYSTSNAPGLGTFTSSDESVVTVDENGTVTAVSKGTAKITFKSANGKSATCTVTVLAEPTEMSLSPETTTLGVGMTGTLTATFGEYELGEPTYESSDTSVATVDEDGTVTAVSEGTATITATVGDNVTATSVITVVPAADTITIDGASTYYVFKGYTFTLPVTMTTSDGSTDCLSTYTVKTSKSSYVSVSGTTIKGVTSGKSATITVTLSNGAKDTVTVKVLAVPTKVKLSASSKTLSVGMTGSLTAKYYSSSTWYTYSTSNAAAMGAFTSSDESVVTVDEDGNLTAVGVGTATVRFKTVNGKYADCTVTVTSGPDGISLSESALTIGEGQSAAITTSYIGDDTLTTLEYTSSDTSVAMVSGSDETCTITAVSAGTATITATAANGQTAVCEVTVRPLATSVLLSAESIVLKLGTEAVLTAELSNGTDAVCYGEPEYSSSDTSIVTVDDSGTLTPVAAGTAIITVSAPGTTGVESSCTVQIIEADVVLSPEALNLGVGETSQLTILVADGLTLEALQSSATDVAVVDENGLVTAISEGTAVITASAGEDTAECVIAVSEAPTGLALSDTALTLEIGSSYALSASLSPEGSASAIVYESSDPSIAMISEDGEITAIAIGTATITAQTFNGCEATCTITVTAVNSRAADLDCADETEQIVLVEYEGNSTATVSFHEKIDGVWTELFSCTGYVGKNGIGKTQEGDKKTPSGTYNLTMAFGIKSDPGANISYTQVTKYHYWCGTSGSEYYNQLVDTRVVDRAATSSDEVLYKYTGVYNYCLFIDYNAEGEAGKGSCIFLHCTGSNAYTSGCIAIPESYMIEAICWVREGAKIVIQ